jgi:hypothetical protein
LEEIVALLDGQAHGLLQQQMLAGRKDGRGHLVMHVTGYDHVDHVQVIALDKLPIVDDRSGVRVGLASGLARFFRRLGNRDQLRASCLGNRSGVVLSPGAVTDESKPYLRICHRRKPSQGNLRFMIDDLPFGLSPGPRPNHNS